MTEQEAREFLASVGYTPGLNNTEGHTGPVVERVKQACRVIKTAELERTRETARRQRQAWQARELPHQAHRAAWDDADSKATETDGEE